MPWDQRSRRRAELPADWHVIRRDVLERDGHTCQLHGPRCTTRATEVDHGDGGRHDHSRANLRAACHPCHADRTSQQGQAARTATRDAEHHPRDRHPAHAD